jgi:hypothetical protein
MVVANNKIGIVALQITTPEIIKSNIKILH